MSKYSELTAKELEALQAELTEQYTRAQELNLKLDMSRGKPSCAQVTAVSKKILDTINSTSDTNSKSGDCLNYGAMDGIDEAKQLMAQLMEVPTENVILFGNSSLNIMFDTVSRSATHGVMGSTPWCKLPSVKWLCPAPGYDRHFSITEYFNIEMITVPMTDDGPDMNMVEKLVAEDDAIKGMWCVPKYSNPTGITYSDETVRRLARLKPAAKDFRIYWDNAYAVHDLYEDKKDKLANLFTECEAAGNPDMIFEFSSTSKVSIPGGGISAIAASAENIKYIKKAMFIQVISHDKINQLRHVRFYKDINGIKAVMSEHAAFLRPKFEATLNTLENELGGLGVGEWTKPLGGYFISFNALPGCAKRIVELCKNAGVTLTGAGATYPYGIDPEDRNIRIAPSFPTPEDMAAAAQIFTICVKLVSVEKLLG